jgi:phosphomannomutase
VAQIDAVFKAYDIRGTVPDQLDAELCRGVGAAFAHLQKAEGATKVLICRDMRPSGEEFVGALAEGITSQGMDVIDLGMGSTDLLYFAAGHFNSPGIMLTASHNPAQYNGMKLCKAGARPVGIDTGLADIKAMVQANEPKPGDSTGNVTKQDVLDEFVKHVHSFVDLSVLRPLKVVADTANGMGGLIVPAVFRDLPFEIDILYPELDGTFPNHPADPIQPENQRDLQARVLETGADVGLAFDGDADRVFLVDNEANLVSGSITTAMVAKSVLEKEPGATIVYNAVCSKTVAEVIEENGGTGIRSKVGHSYIKAIMAENNAAFGGEHSAHYYFRNNYFADSGIIAAIISLGMLCASDQTLAEYRRPFDRYVASGEINTEVADVKGSIEKVAGVYKDAKQDRLDGLTVDMGDWWFSLRGSNTEPLLRLNLEAKTKEECEQHTQEVLALFRTA